MQDLLSVQVELAVYRKGSLSVQLNFQQGIMSWQESRQWCNNFVRSLSDEQMREMMNTLRESGLLTAVPALAPPAGKGSSLLLSLTYADRQVELTGEDVPPAGWASLRSQIERLSRVPFQL
jgi:hypothetical protein